MIEPSTSQSALADPATRDRLPTGGRGPTAPREFARVLRDQAHGRVSSGREDGAQAFSEGGLLHPDAPRQSGHTSLRRTPVDVSNEHEEASTADAEQPEPGTAHTSAASVGAARAGDDRSRTELRITLRPIVAGEQADLVAPSLPNLRRANAPHSDVQRQPRAAGGARLLTRMATASMPLRVAIVAIEQGVAVRIATSALDDAERRDLTDRIAELLARHGYAGATVSVNGMTMLLPFHQGQDTWR